MVEPLSFWPKQTPPLAQRIRAGLGRRATALVIALAIQVLLLLALLSLGLVAPTPEPKLTTVDLSAQDYSEPAPDEPTPEKSPPKPTAQQTPQPVETTVPVPVQPPAAVIPLPTAPRVPPPAPAPPPPPVPADQPAYGPPNTGRPASTDSERVGTAPDGSPLYRAQWYREPGQEFFGYFSTASSGTGLMACRTIANWLVTDCVALGDTPGSRINNSMLAGAGTLMVRPPRLGGRSLVGSWVRIQITYGVRRQ
jgi:protein TonB